MNILRKFSEWVGPDDPELVKKTLARLSEQDTWNDVFSTKLIELLDKIDKVKSEIRERLSNADERIQRAESVTQAESLLLEKASEFGDASRRLELAEAAQERASLSAANAKNQLEEATSALDSARKLAVKAMSLADDANRKFCSSRDAELKAARLSRLTVRYATVAIALSWIAMGWTGWFIVRTEPFLWIAVALSFLITVAAVFILRGTRSDT